MVGPENFFPQAPLPHPWLLPVCGGGGGGGGQAPVMWRVRLSCLPQISYLNLMPVYYATAWDLESCLSLCVLFVVVAFYVTSVTYSSHSSIWKMMLAFPLVLFSLPENWLTHSSPSQSPYASPNLWCGWERKRGDCKRVACHACYFFSLHFQKHGEKAGWKLL